MKRLLALGLGLITGFGLHPVGGQGAIAQSAPVAALPESLLVPRRETVTYPGGNPSVTVTAAQNPAAVTLTISPARRPEEVTLSLQANSLQAGQCALVSVQLPPNLLVGNDTYQLNTTPIILVPLTSQAGYCGNANVYRQTYVSQSKTTHQALLRLPFTPDGTTRIPFTVEVFFTQMLNE